MSKETIKAISARIKAAREAASKRPTKATAEPAKKTTTRKRKTTKKS